MHLPFDDPVLLVLIVLASARLTRLVVDDDIAERPRLWLAGLHDWIASLVSCHWCAGFWISAAVIVVVANFATHPLTTLLLVIFATSHVVGLIAGSDDS